MSDGNGFDCNAKALTKAERERHNQVTKTLMQARLETRELPDGYAFRLRGDAVTLIEIAAWVSAERKCCPFFDFGVDVQRENGPLWLRLTGAAGIKAFIRSEFEFPQH